MRFVNDQQYHNYDQVLHVIITWTEVILYIQLTKREICVYTGMFAFRLYCVKNKQLQFYIPKNENFTRQIGQISYDFHSSDGVDNHIGAGVGHVGER